MVMNVLTSVILLFLCYLTTSDGNGVRVSREIDDEFQTTKRFPDNFMFGVSSSAYQTEGAWLDDGKGLSVWDDLILTDSGFIADKTNGTIAANSYHNYKRDIEMLKELGVNFYRFSISWPRILPTGHKDYINPLGIAHYNKLINELIANGIEPFVTMFHWDLPIKLSDHGGWTNEKMIDWFEDYASVLFHYFGDRVKYWLPINEPYIHCHYGYAIGGNPPRIKSPGVGFYECGRNILLAHARVYHLYNKRFRRKQRGEIALVLNMEWPIASSDSNDDAEAVLDVLAFNFGQFMQPIFSQEGNYPQRMIDRIARNSAREGLNASRLRPFTPEQVKYIKGTADFLALHHYSADYVYRNASIVGMYESPSHDEDTFYCLYKDPTWPSSASPWLAAHAPSFYDLLIYVKNTYNNPKIFITENGYSSGTGLNDDNRVDYIRTYLEALLNALNDGVDIRGYSVWGLMDNFEWAFGYTTRFGLYEVDIENPNRTRTPRKSAFVYKEIIRTKIIDFHYDPDAVDSAFSIQSSALLIFVLSLIHIKVNLNCM